VLALTPAIPGAPAETVQAYRLTSGADGIRIEGVDAAGVFHGTCTLLQIIDNQRAPSRMPVSSFLSQRPSPSAPGQPVPVSKLLRRRVIVLQ